jgi:glutamine cyclotransferase
MISDSTSFVLPTSQISSRTIRPIAATSLHGIAFVGDSLVAIDTKSGYLLKIDPKNHNTEIINPQQWSEFIGVTGLAIANDTLWFTSVTNIYYCDFKGQDFTPQLFARLTYPANGIAIYESTIYVSSQKSGNILVYSQKTAQEVARFYAPGIGIENLTVRGEELWVSDTL